MSEASPKEIFHREGSELRAAVRFEIERGRKSKYWIGATDAKVSSEFDFDVARLAADMQALFPHLRRDAILVEINSKIFWHHLR